MTKPRKAHKPLEITLVERQEQIDEICAECRAEGKFAFDTEFVMEDRYESDVCLIQIATEKSLVLIDPLLGFDITGVWSLVYDDQVETLVHAGQEDLALCVLHTGEVPRRIFDLQIAAGLITNDYPVSLQKLVQTFLHIRLHKSKTLTDWRRRPLTPEQQRYAAEDVAHLLPIHRIIMNYLKRTDRLDWANAEFAKFEELTLYRRAEEDKLQRVKGAGSLKGRELAVLRELLAWREKAAEGLNRPARTVLRDHLLIEIARTGMSSTADLADLRGLNLSSKNIRGASEVIVEALKLPEDRWPKTIHREVETAQEQVLITLVTALLRAYCLENDIAYGLVGTKKSIRDLIRFHCKNRADGGELTRGWRGEAVGQLLREVLTGKRTMHVTIKKGQPHLKSSRIEPRTK